MFTSLLEMWYQLKLRDKITYKDVAKKLGKTTSFIHMCIHEQRSILESDYPKWIEVLKLNEDEAKSFKALANIVRTKFVINNTDFTKEQKIVLNRLIVALNSNKKDETFKKLESIV